MNRYLKISAALAAFALLLVVMGLSTSNVVNAQKAVTAESPSIYLCTDSKCNVAGDATPDATTHDNVFTLSFPGETVVTIQNLDLPRVTQKVDISSDAFNAETRTPSFIDGPDANPKVITLDNAGAATIVAVHKSSGLDDARLPRSPDTDGDGDIDLDDDAYGAKDGFGYTLSGYTYQVKAFNGNRIQITQRPTAGDEFPTIKTVTVDNVAPSLVTNSPSIPLIVTDGVDLTFSADITDSGAGFTGDIDKIHLRTDRHGSLDNDEIDTVGNENNDVTDHGGMRLVVAGNVVQLGKGNFSKIDGGWNVWATINSSAIQSISPNTPWYFEARDRSGNLARTSGSIAGKADSGTIGSITDDKFLGSLHMNTFIANELRITRDDADGNPVDSNDVAFTFNSGTGVLTFTNSVEDPLFDDAITDVPDTEDTIGYQCVLLPEDEQVAVTGGSAGETAQLTACGGAKGASYQVLNSNLITIDSEEPTLSGASVLTGVGLNSATGKDKSQKNSIKVTFSDAGAEDSDAPGSGLDSATVTAAAFSVSGNSVTSVAVKGNSVFLTLSDNLGSTERPSVNVAGGLIKDKAGNAFGGIRVAKAVDNLGPNLTLSRSAALSNDKVTVTISTDEQLNAAPVVYVTRAANRDGDAPIGTAVPANQVRQNGAQSYTYAHSTASGEFSVYAKGSDTGENSSTVGDDESSSSAGAFSFELDKMLNNGLDPIVSVSDNEDVGSDDSAVEQVDPMIVTVDFSQEGKEYSRDSYRTVELTSATLKVTFTDGTSDTKTFNLTTEISSPDSVKFTIPLLNPKIGDYTLTVKAQDTAGNVRTDGTGTTAESLVTTWEVIAPSPVDIALAPGWNLISLPFQPANPATNSVINASHPADIVMTFDNATQVWLVSRRDAETGLFVGDITVMTASTAYFIRTENFQAIRMLRPPLATAAAAPPPPPAITVVKGWNLVPVVSNAIPTPAGVAADNYFGTLGGGTDAGWLKALTFDTLVRTWTSVTPGETMTLSPGDDNPCSGEVVNKDDVEDGSEPCQVGQYSERSSDRGDIRIGDELSPDDEDEDLAEAGDADDNGDGYDDEFDGQDKVTVRIPVEVGKGYWLYSTVDGVIIP